MFIGSNCDRKTAIAEINYKCPLWISRSSVSIDYGFPTQKFLKKISKTSCLRTKFGNPQYWKHKKLLNFKFLFFNNILETFCKYRTVGLEPKRIEYILERNLLEISVKRPFCCTVSILQVYFTYLCYITFWALEQHFMENLKLILKVKQIMK